MKFLKKYLPFVSKASLLTIIVTVLVFSPLTWAPKQTMVVEAGGGLATEFSNIGIRAEAAISAIENRIQTGFQGQTAFATVGNFLKENVLDGIGWTIAKTVLSSMVRSLINWVNSGFQGSPAFITDIKQHLLGVLDEAAGEFIRSLGGIGEFICSPFRLDVQAALSINYGLARSGMPSGPDQNMCRLSDIGSNIENFLSGTAGSWDDWFRVTSNPQNLPLGAYFAAEASLNARLINEAGQEITLANWGSGFLSQRLCQAIEGSSAQNCTITTPGRVISEALTFSTSVGPRSLIEADEINELVGALLNQLMLQAMQGINGLLGLGGNQAFASFDPDGNSFLDRMVAEQGLLGTDNTLQQIENNITLETKFLTMSNEAIALGQTSTSTPVVNVVNDARTWREKTLITLAILQESQTILSSSTAPTNTKQTAITNYTNLSTSNSLSTQSFIQSKHIEWQQVLPNLTRPTFEN
jgi:hypothetical protein